MPTGYTTVSASHLQDATGTLIANATIYFTPVDNNGKPLSFRAGGSEGQVASKDVSAVVNNGDFSIVLADTTLTTPVNVGYSVRCVDNLTGLSLLGRGYECVQPSGETWSFDSYLPDVAAQVTVIVGPQGPPGVVTEATSTVAGSVKLAFGQTNATLSRVATSGIFDDIEGVLPPGQGGTGGSISTINNGDLMIALGDDGPFGSVHMYGDAVIDSSGVLQIILFDKVTGDGYGLQMVNGVLTTVIVAPVAP